MEMTNDRVFGEMTYCHGWKKVELFPGFGNLQVIVESHSGEGISIRQQEMYGKFKQAADKFLEMAQEKMEEYFARIYTNGESTKAIPYGVYFSQTDRWGFLFLSPVAEDVGFAVVTGDHIQVGTDDILI